MVRHRVASWRLSGRRRIVGQNEVRREHKERRNRQCAYNAGIFYRSAPSRGWEDYLCSTRRDKGNIITDYGLSSNRLYLLGQPASQWSQLPIASSQTFPSQP